MRPAKDLRDATGCAVMLVHHGRKERGGSLVNRAHGSTALTGQADQILNITKPGGNARSTIRDIEITGRFGIDDEVVKIELIEEKGYILNEDSDPRNAILSLFANVPGLVLSANKIIESTRGRIGKNVARRTIEELVKAGVLQTNGEVISSRNFGYRVVDQQAADAARQRVEPVSLDVQ